MQESRSDLKSLRYTASEILACAILRMFPGTLLVEGEVSDIGFHYDFVFKKPINAEALPIIEEQMRFLTQSKHPFRILEMMRQNAAAFFLHQKQAIKADLVQNMRDEIVRVVEWDGFHDCYQHTFIDDFKKVKHFRLQSLEEFEEDGVVTRIVGTAFFQNDELKKFLKLFDTAKDCDPITLSSEMDLIAQKDQLYVKPKGCQLQDLLWQLRKRSDSLSFQEIVSPALMLKDNFGKYSYLYPTIEERGDEYVVFPDPRWTHPFLIKQDKIFEEMLPIHTLECFKEIDGLIDIGNIFCKKIDIGSLIISRLQFIDKTFKMFGFEYVINLCTNNSLKLNQKEWLENVNTLEESLRSLSLRYILDKEERTFYGPMVQIKWKDFLGRYWDGPFIAINMLSEKHFQLQYVKREESLHPLNVISYSILGPLNRLMLLLVEHYAGNLPLWLMPEQVRIVTVGDKPLSEAKKLLLDMNKRNIRCGIDSRAVPLKEKMRSSRKEKVPYVVIWGEKEEKKGMITLRSNRNHEESLEISVEDFFTQIEKEIEQKVIG